jgi:hypothetical protein
MGWVGLGWNGLGWDGMEWVGMGWIGMGWDGMGWVELYELSTGLMFKTNTEQGAQERVWACQGRTNTKLEKTS